MQITIIYLPQVSPTHPFAILPWKEDEQQDGLHMIARAEILTQAHGLVARQADHSTTEGHFLHIFRNGQNLMTIIYDVLI